LDDLDNQDDYGDEENPIDDDEEYGEEERE
jgi:hypothetical protein